MNWNEFKQNVENWAAERGIYEHSTPEAQLLKALSELGELADAVVKNDRDGLKDAIGDVAVCVVNYAYMLSHEIEPPIGNNNKYFDINQLVGKAAYDVGLLLLMQSGPHVADRVMQVMFNTSHYFELNFMDCCAAAWNEIKDRKGRMVPGGAFVKDE